MEGVRLSVFLLLGLLTCFSRAKEIEAEPGSTTKSIEDAAAVERFRSYLRIRCVHPNPDYGPSVDFILERASSIGLESRTLEFVKGKPLVVLTWQGKEPSLPSILLNSHMDVVPAEAAKWEHEPFGAFMDSEGNIYARGAQDMKCVGMQYLEALWRLKADGFTPTRTIHVSFVPDEEIGGVDGAKAFVKSEEFKNLNVGVLLDEGLANPGEAYRIYNGERSPWWLIIRSQGTPGHGSTLYDNSAMENLLKSLEAISRYRTSQFDLIKSGLAAEGEVVSVNPVFLKAGTATPTGFVMNLQPSEAAAGFDIRVPPFADPAALMKRIEEEWAPASRNLTFSFTQHEPVEGTNSFTAVDDSNPWWSLLQESIKKGGGKIKKPEIFPAATDARYVREEGIPAFGFSPMSNTEIRLHDHNEYLNIGEYLKGIEIYQIIINSFANFRPDASSTEEPSHSEL